MLRCYFQLMFWWSTQTQCDAIQSTQRTCRAIRRASISIQLALSDSHVCIVLSVLNGTPFLLQLPVLSWVCQLEKALASLYQVVLNYYRKGARARKHNRGSSNLVVHGEVIEVLYLLFYPQRAQTLSRALEATALYCVHSLDNMQPVCEPDRPGFALASCCAKDGNHVEV